MRYLPSEFPLEPGLCYLNHAAVGPWPLRTVKAVNAFAQRNLTRGAADYPSWLEVVQRLRRRLAALVGAEDPDDIALLKNTSEALSLVGQGLPWRAGDNIVGVADDFCSNRMVWESLADRGVGYRPVDALAGDDPEGRLIDALVDDVRLLAVSTVHFATGYRFDIARLSAACRERSVLLVVDAIQSLGAVPFDLAETPVDFLAWGSHKWLLAPEGIGCLYCRREQRDRLRLQQFGWGMRAAPFAFESTDWAPSETATRFEPGTPNMLGIHALDASLDLFEEIGMDTVSRMLADNVARLEDGLRALPGIEIVTPADPARRAGILTFRAATLDGAALYDGLMQRGVICSPRAGGVRLAPHFYTRPDVLARTIETIAELAGRAG